MEPTKANEYLSNAPILYVYDAFYVIGGRTKVGDAPGVIDEIGRIDPKVGLWSLVGNLQQARKSHNVIFDGQYLVVVGGEPAEDSDEAQFLTERCSFSPEAGSETILDCFGQPPLLEGYHTYPELYLVEEDFCQI